MKLPKQYRWFSGLVGLPTLMALYAYQRFGDPGSALGAGMAGVFFVAIVYGLVAGVKFTVRKLRGRVDAKELPDQSKPQEMSPKMFVLSYVVPNASTVDSGWVA